MSHALFRVMTQPQCLKGKIRKEKFSLLLRQYQEEMLDAYPMEDDYFPELFRYCNILFETLPTILMSTELRTDKDVRKLAAIALGFSLGAYFSSLAFLMAHCCRN